MLRSLCARYGHILKAAILLAAIATSLSFAFLLRFDFNVPPDMTPFLFTGLLVAMPVKLGVFWLSGLLRSWWRVCGLPDAYRVFAVNVVAAVAFACATWLVIGPDFPRAVYVIDLLLCVLATGFIRFFDRFAREVLWRSKPKSGFKTVLIYGAGAAGATLAREIHANPSLKYDIAGFLDDDRGKTSSWVMGVRVLGTGRLCTQIAENARRRGHPLDEVIIAMPSATGVQMREAIANVRAADLACKTFPGVSDLLRRESVTLNRQIRNVDVQDLIGGEPVQLDAAKIRRAIHGQVVLVTGGAGSIGSELCRQIAMFEPRRLVVLDQSENDLYRLDLELRASFPSIGVSVEIGDIRDAGRLDQIFLKHSVQQVFHAAAYKHVAMMELNTCEAVKTNVLGTWNLVHAAHKHGVENCLMISSDKAMNPASVMGATKRAAELVVSSMAHGARGLRFMSVRFGNVLGTSGSVVSLFEQQIANGGPVTVTHPDARRYFMTVRDAVQLVLQASTLAQEPAVYVLDMGEAVRVVDLARNVIRLAGLEPDKDIEIRYIGLRPGEKLVEEAISKDALIKSTDHEKIKMLQGPPVNGSLIEMWIHDLQRLLAEGDDLAVRDHLRELIPEFSGRLQEASFTD